MGTVPKLLAPVAAGNMLLRGISPSPACLIFCIVWFRHPIVYCNHRGRLQLTADSRQVLMGGLRLYDIIKYAFIWIVFLFIAYLFYQNAGANSG